MARAVIRAIFTLGLCVVLLSACSNAPALRSAAEIEKWIEHDRDQNTKPEERKIGCELQGYQLPDDFSLEHHVLVSDSEGNVIPRDPEQKKGFDEAFRTIMLGFAKEVERKNDKPPRLLFYFNGGLNPQAAVEEQAARQVPCMIADGYYPVFFVWDTEGVSSYWEQVTSVWDGQIYHDAVTRVRTPLMVLGNVFSGIGQAPADYAIHGRRFWRALRREPRCSLLLKPEDSKNCPIEQKVNYVDAEGKACLYQNALDGRKKICPEQNVVVDDKPDERQREVPEFIYYSLLAPVRWLTTPFAHGVGEAAWTNMLRRTRTTIRRSIEFNLDRHADEDGDGMIDGPSKCPKHFRELVQHFPRGTGAFARFFEMLELYRDRANRLPPRFEWSCGDVGDEPEKAPSEEQLDQEKKIGDAFRSANITLIGHSMGAIVINQLLERFPNLPYNDIVVMASAASLRDTRRVLDRYFEDVERSKDTRIFSLMLHPLNDTRERQYGGAVPSGSLLMWIDEMYDVPKTPEDKVFGFWPTAKPVLKMFGRSTQERMLYHVFSRPHAQPKRPSNPVEHGHFNEDDMCFWRPAFWGVRGTVWESRYKDLPERALIRCGEKHTAPQRQ